MVPRAHECQHRRGLCVVRGGYQRDGRVQRSSIQRVIGLYLFPPARYGVVLCFPPSAHVIPLTKRQPTPYRSCASQQYRQNHGNKYEKHTVPSREGQPRHRSGRGGGVDAEQNQRVFRRPGHGSAVGVCAAGGRRPTEQIPDAVTSGGVRLRVLRVGDDVHTAAEKHSSGQTDTRQSQQ